MTLNLIIKTTLSIMTLSIMTLNTTTLSIMIKNHTRHDVMNVNEPFQFWSAAWCSWLNRRPTILSSRVWIQPHTRKMAGKKLTVSRCKSIHFKTTLKTFHFWQYYVAKLSAAHAITLFTDRTCSKLECFSLSVEKFTPQRKWTTRSFNYSNKVSFTVSLLAP